MRLNIFDGLRGHLLIGMLVAHLSFNEGLEFLDYFHHYAVIELYDAGFFVFIAGLLVAYLWNVKLTDSARRWQFMKKRLWTIYRFYLISAIPFLLYSLYLGEGAISTTLGILAMQLGGWYSDILPIYFVCFVLLLPFALFTSLYRPGLVLGFSLAIYIGSQLTNIDGFFGFAGLFVGFDIAAWQFLFFSSMMIGNRAMQIRQAILDLSGRSALILFLTLLVVYGVIIKSDWFPDPSALGAQKTFYEARMGLHPLYLLRIYVACALGAMILIRADGVLRYLHEVAVWYFSLSFIRNVGKYSINMFVLHVYMIAVYKAVVADQPDATKISYAVLAIAVFVAAPNLIEFRKGRRTFVAG